MYSKPKSAPKIKPQRRGLTKIKLSKMFKMEEEYGKDDNKSENNLSRNPKKPLKRTHSEESVIYVGTKNLNDNISVVDLTKSDSTIQRGKGKKMKLRKNSNKKVASNDLVRLKSAKTVACASSEDCGLVRACNNIILNANRFNTYEGETYKILNSSSSNMQLKRTYSLNYVTNLNDFNDDYKVFYFEGKKDGHLYIKNIPKVDDDDDDDIDSTDLNEINVAMFNMGMDTFTEVDHVESTENVDTLDV